MRIAPPLTTELVARTATEPSDEQRLPVGEGPIVFGRYADNELVLRDPLCARRHGRLQWEDGHRPSPHLVIDDYGAVNGVFVNGRRVTHHVLHVGDVVTVGRTTLYFLHRLPAAAPAGDEELRLRGAVLAAPDDDAPRLIYADWLGERGDPRGELIALQVAAARLPVGEARRRELERQAGELLAAHEAAWIAPLPIPVEDWRLRRGFVEAVRVPVGALYDRHLAALWQHHPIRCVAPTPGSGVIDPARPPYPGAPAPARAYWPDG